MSYLVIARKWRPQNFADIAGQEPITRTLQNAIRTNRIAHAFLFTGVRGVGKTTAARVLAKALNCVKGPTPNPCNECPQCREISQGSSIDVLEIDGASNRGIDEVRQIIENVRYQPANSRYKIYIIDEVHQVTKDAFNALLKTLEEPPPSVKFILATTEPQRLPPTILSRCQRYDFRRINLREIVARLGAIAKSEGLAITEGALVLLAREADGSMRDAQSLLEQVLAVGSGGDGEAKRGAVDERLLQEVLGLAERRVLYEISAAVLAGDARRCVELVADVVNQGRDIGRLSRDLVEHFRNLLVARLASKRRQETATSAARTSFGASLLDLPDQEIADLTEQSSTLSVETLLDYFDFMSSGDEDVSRSATPRFALESVLVRLTGLPKSLPVTELIERLEQLEGKMTTSFRRDDSAPQTNALNETTAAPASAVAPRETVAPPGHADRWREFVAYVGREKKFLASHLDASKALELPPPRMRIGVSERHHLAFLLDGDNLAALKDLANGFFAQDVNVQIVNLVPETANTGAEIPSAAGASAADERTPMVKEALRIFGGAVRTVRKDG
ncbi:MAG: DNA polymerase III subunit gamma/tau [Chloroflexota bacterium]